MFSRAFMTNNNFCKQCWIPQKEGKFCRKCGEPLVPLTEVRIWCNTCAENKKDGQGIVCETCGNLLNIPSKEEYTKSRFTNTQDTAFARQQSRMLETSSGRIIKEGYIEDELKRWHMYNSTSIQGGGVPEIGDEVEFITYQGTIKRVWLLKSLGCTLSTTGVINGGRVETTVETATTLKHDGNVDSSSTQLSNGEYQARTNEQRKSSNIKSIGDRNSSANSPICGSKRSEHPNHISPYHTIFDNNTSSTNFQRTAITPRNSCNASSAYSVQQQPRLGKGTSSTTQIYGVTSPKPDNPYEGYQVSNGGQSSSNTTNSNCTGLSNLSVKHSSQNYISNIYGNAQSDENTLNKNNTVNSNCLNVSMQPSSPLVTNPKPAIKPRPRYNPLVGIEQVINEQVKEMDAEKKKTATSNSGLKSLSGAISHKNISQPVAKPRDLMRISLPQDMVDRFNKAEQTRSNQNGELNHDKQWKPQNCLGNIAKPSVKPRISLEQKINDQIELIKNQQSLLSKSDRADNDIVTNGIKDEQNENYDEDENDSDDEDDSGDDDDDDDVNGEDKNKTNNEQHTERIIKRNRRNKKQTTKRDNNSNNNNNNKYSSKEITIDNTATPVTTETLPNGKSPLKQQRNDKRMMARTGWVMKFIAREEKPFGFIRENTEETGNSGTPVQQQHGEKKDIFFPFESVLSNMLQLDKGDEVEFRLYNPKKPTDKPRAGNVIVKRLRNRSNTVIREYLEKIYNYMVYNDENEEGQNRKSVNIMKILNSPTVWKEIVYQISSFENDDYIVYKLLQVLLEIRKHIRTLEEKFRQVLLQITSSTKFFNPVKGRMKEFIAKFTEDEEEDAIEVLQEFLQMIMKMVPEKRPVVIAMIKPMMKNPNGKTAIFLYQILKTMSSGMGESVSDLEWRDLPLILKKEEIFDPDLNNMINLKPVQDEYSSPDEYVDVYFRLLREDCFNTLRKCIKQLINGSLDNRDMSVYINIALIGYDLKDNSLYLALKLKPVREVKNWETSSNLMYGNLLCISIGGNFQNPIWVTVSNREMLKKDNVVVVQTCWEWNDMDDAEIMLNLITAKGSVVMVESPTYYKAFQPILKTLQSLECDEISFVDELVYLQHGELPDFLFQGTDFPADIVHKNATPNSRTTIAQFLATPYSSNSVFDESQEEAVKTALQNRIGIIQGPPGCGKSFIGVQMLRLLLSLSTLSDPRVLVLTYKNHALDEFLKDIMKYVKSSDLVRLGGRCKDEDLEKISLNSLKRANKKNADMWVEINALKDSSKDIQESIDEEFKYLNNLRTFHYDMLLKELSHEQNISLLLNCDWENMNVSVNVASVKDQDGFQKQKKKKNKGQRVNKKLVEEMLRSPDENENALAKLLKEALRRWIPSERAFDEFESQLIGTKTVSINLNQLSSKWNSNNNKKGKGDAVELYELNDEQDIEDIQKERLAALTKSDFNVKGGDRNKTLRLVNYKQDESDENNGSYKIKSFTSRALDQLTSTNAGILLTITDLWDLTEDDRVQFVQFHIAKATEEIRNHFQGLLKDYESKSKEIIELENKHLARIINEKKIIGATITGAAIHQQVLKEVQPEIVIIEEAAEVLEPQLLAAIGTWTKYMLLIGDHKQLRPPVECYELRKDYNFDISMMERLINNKMPFSTLTMQNRQRPEFAELLYDIYPNLQTNHNRVANNMQAKCFLKSSFFWHHISPEVSGRSVTNPDEALRCVKLALFLVEQGYEPQSITILATYQGQTALIRKILKDHEQKHPDLFKAQAVTQQTAKGTNQKVETIKNMIKIHTVDMYQGDENDFVIVSLVRSNTNRAIGFLKEQNRRCVAQSRAKCGVYFVGNADMFIGHPKWKYMVEKLKETNRLGDSMEIVCENHPAHIALKVKDSTELKFGLSYCRLPCKTIMSCHIHQCRRPCKPPHSHKPCPEKVQFQFPVCGHTSVRKCEDDESQMQCKEVMKFIFPNCNHPGERQCCQDLATVICNFEVQATLPCNHSAKKYCFQNIDGIKCFEQCAKKRNCGHSCVDHLCHQHETIKTCKACIKLEEAKKVEQRKQEEKLRRVNAELVDKEIERLREEASRTPQGAIKKELYPRGETASEYLDVEDLVKKYIQPGHNWYPEVTRIEKVTNFVLLIKFLQAKKKIFDPEGRTQLKFHGTSVDGVKGITENGFRLPTAAGMYGCGIYLASDSSKSAQDLYTKGSNMLLLCEALLGKSFTVDKAWNGMTNDELRRRRYDSLFAKRGTRETGGVRYDEFVLYNPDQVYPKYIIHFRCGTFKPDKIAPVIFTQDFATGKRVIKSKRETDCNNALENHFCYVESRFLRMLQRRNIQEKCEITYIEYYTNSILKAAFDRKHEEFKKKYQGNQIVLGFHGTKDNSVVDSIMNTNFRRSNQGKFGAGVYFSEEPSYTFNYGGRNHLIMAQLLPGNTKECQVGWSNNGCTPGYDSHGGFKQPDGTFSEIVIFNTEQILPAYVIHFEVRK